MILDDAKRCVLLAALNIRAGDRVHDGMSRTLSEQCFEFGQGVDGALRNTFNGIVFEIGHEALQVECIRSVENKPTEANALDLSVDYEVDR